MTPSPNYDIPPRLAAVIARMQSHVRILYTLLGTMGAGLVTLSMYCVQ